MLLTWSLQRESGWDCCVFSSVYIGWAKNRKQNKHMSVAFKMRQNVSSNIILKIQEIHSFLLKNKCQCICYIFFLKRMWLLFELSWTPNTQIWKVYNNANDDNDDGKRLAFLYAYLIILFLWLTFCEFFKIIGVFITKETLPQLKRAYICQKSVPLIEEFQSWKMQLLNVCHFMIILLST